MLKHVLVTKIEKADSLSRRPDWKIGVDRDNKDQVFIKDCWLCSLHEVVIKELEVDIVEKIKRVRSKDEEVVRVVEEMKKARIRALRGEEWKLKRDLVLKEGKVYMLKDKELRVEIIWLHHDIHGGAYGGSARGRSGAARERAAGE